MIRNSWNNLPRIVRVVLSTLSIIAILVGGLVIIGMVSRTWYASKISNAPECQQQADREFYKSEISNGDAFTITFNDKGKETYEVEWRDPFWFYRKTSPSASTPWRSMLGPGGTQAVNYQESYIAVLKSRNSLDAYVLVDCTNSIKIWEGASWVSMQRELEPTPTPVPTTAPTRTPFAVIGDDSEQGD